MNIFSIIPARGGSKRIPNKNIQKINGIPLIEKTIQSSFNSKLISRTFVISNDKDILEISKGDICCQYSEIKIKEKLRR